MCKADDRGSAEAGILESEPDVNQHQDKCHNDRIESSRLHFGTDRGTDRLGGDVVLVYAELVLQSHCKCRTLCLIELLGLENHFAAARDLLYLRVRVSCHLCDHRDDLLVDLIEAHVLVECDVGRCTAHEIKAVVQSAFSAGCVERHACKSRDDHNTGDREDDLPLACEVNDPGIFCLAVQLLILRTKCVEDVHEKSCDKQGREHGHNDTDGQCVSEALDRAGSKERQNRCRDQCCHVTVYNSGQSLVKTALHSHSDSLAVADLLADTGEDDNVGVNRHTDGKQDTCNTGQSQCDVKCVQNDRNDQDVNAKCQCRAQAGQPVDRAHKDCYQCKTQNTCCFTRSDRVLTQLGAYDLGTKSLQFNFQTTDTNVGSKALRLFDGALTRDDSAAVCDRRLYSRNADELAVIIDTDGLARRISLCGGVCELLLAFIRKGKGDNDLLVVHVVGLIAGFRLQHVCTLQHYVAVRDDLVQVLCQHIAVVAVRVHAERVVIISIGISLPDKIQRAGTSQFFQDLVGLFYAGNAGNLNIDSVISFRVDLRLRAVLVNTLLQLVDSVRHILCGRCLVAYSLISNAGAAREVKSQLDVVVRSSVPIADADQSGVGHETRDDRC